MLQHKGRSPWSAEPVRQQSPSQSSVFSSLHDLVLPEQQHSKQPFSSSQSRDLPPKLRAIVEDNKMLQQGLKELRHRERQDEMTISKQQREIAAQHLSLQGMRQQLKDRGLSPSRGDMHGHERLEARVTELEAHVQIAMDAKDAELKRREQEAATHERAQDKLKAEIARLHGCLEEGDKERRAKTLEHKGSQARVKKLQEDLRTTRSQLTQMRAQVEAFARKNKHHAMQVMASQVTTPGKTAPFVPPIIFDDDEEDERDVHVMLCMVLPENADAFHLQVAEEKRIQKAEAWGGMLRPENAATAIQAAFRGHFTRKDLQHKQRNAAELAAAIKLQAAARGMLVRAAMTRQREATLAASIASRSKGARQSAVKLQRKGSMGSSGFGPALGPASRKSSTLTTRKSGTPADAGSDAKPPRSISGAPVPPLNLARVSSSGGSILVRKPSVGAAAKAMLASKQMMQEPSAKFPLPAAKAPSGSKLSGHESGTDIDGQAPGSKPGLETKMSSVKKVAGLPAGRSRTGGPRPSR
ncbi:hypothetical protein WJX84_008780 [Apatococcus fuscideae]